MRRRSRAAEDLDRAQSSGCEACGRTTKTISGVCAECWAPKEPGARGTFAREPRVEPLLDLDALEAGGSWSPAWLVAAAVVSVVVAAVAVILAG